MAKRRMKPCKCGKLIYMDSTTCRDCKRVHKGDGRCKSCGCKLAAYDRKKCRKCWEDDREGDMTTDEELDRIIADQLPTMPEEPRNQRNNLKKWRPTKYQLNLIGCGRFKVSKLLLQEW